MTVQWTTNRQFVLPEASDGVSVTPSGVAMSGVSTGWSNWFEMVAETEVAYVPTGIQPGANGIGDVRFEVELGISDPAAAVSTSVAIGILQGDFRDVSGSAKHGGLYFSRPLDKVPAGKRIAIRMRKRGTDITPWLWTLLTLKKPIVGNLDLSTKSMSVYPVGIDWPQLSSTGATEPWGDPSEWTEILASIPAGMILTHLSNPRRSNGEEYLLEFGVGDTPTPVGPHWRGSSGLGDGPHCIRLENPYSGFSAFAGQKLSVRQYLEDNADSVHFGMCYEHD